MDMQIGGLLGLIHLVLVIWAVVNIVQSRAESGAKILWIIGIIIFPLVGFIVWLLVGPRRP